MAPECARLLNIWAIFYSFCFKSHMYIPRVVLIERHHMLIIKYNYTGLVQSQSGIEKFEFDPPHLVEYPPPITIIY